MRTIGQIIRGHAARQPDRPAVVSIDKVPLSFAQLQRQIDEIGIQLGPLARACQARIGLAVLKGPEAVVLIAALACHATVVPINNSLSQDELRQLFDAARLDALIMSKATAAEMRYIAHDLKIPIIDAITKDGPNIDCELIVPNNTAAAACSEAAPDPIAVIIQTSGTTGQPKLVPITHGNFIAEAANLKSWFNLGPDDRSLSFVPLQYAHGIRETLFPALITGGSIARPANHLELSADWLRVLKPTWYSAFPIHHRCLFQALRGMPGTSKPLSLRFALSSGTPLDPDLQCSLSRLLGAPVLEFYGFAEAGHVTANLPPPRKNKPGTCGIPLDDQMIISRDGRSVRPGELGEVLVRGESVIAGYLNNPEANREKFVNGWFRTGDLGSLDTEGFLSLHGRLSELINRGGEKVAPCEVEQALVKHPAVSEAAAFSVPHPRLGEDVGAAVVLRLNHTISPGELRMFVRAQLAQFKVPRTIMLVDKLPKDVTGKVRRRELAADAVNGAGHPHNANDDDPFAYSPLARDLVELWKRVLQRDSVELDDDFFHAGGDSLRAAEMLQHVEQLTGRALTGSVLFDAPTIRRFIQAVVQSDTGEATSLYSVGLDRTAPPLFFFHGDLTTGGYYVRRLAAVFGDRTNIIAVSPHKDPVSIEQMAKEDLELMLKIQPRGPFRLAGFCNGGIVAFEVAHLLRSAGQEVALLALLDVPTINASRLMRALKLCMLCALRITTRDSNRREHLFDRWASICWRIHAQAARFVSANYEMRKAKLLRRLKRQVLTTRRCINWRSTANRRSRCESFEPDVLPGHIRMALREDHYLKLLARYFLLPLDIPIVYYACENSGRHLKRITSRLDIMRMPGDHFSCITTNLPVMAEHLRSRLSSNLQNTNASTATLAEGQRAPSDASTLVSA